MLVDRETLYKVAHLSRLEIKPENEQEFLEGLTSMVEWVAQLQQVNTEGIEPLIHVSQEVNRIREDENEPHLTHERALKNAPAKDSDYFRVPKVLE